MGNKQLTNETDRKYWGTALDQHKLRVLDTPRELRINGVRLFEEYSTYERRGGGFSEEQVIALDTSWFKDDELVALSDTGRVDIGAVSANRLIAFVKHRTVIVPTEEY